MWGDKAAAPIDCHLSVPVNQCAYLLCRARFRGHGAQGPRPPTKRGPPTKPFNFYFAPGLPPVKSGPAIMHKGKWLRVLKVIGSTCNLHISVNSSFFARQFAYEWRFKIHNCTQGMVCMVLYKIYFLHHYICFVLFYCGFFVFFVLLLIAMSCHCSVCVRLSH